MKDGRDDTMDTRNPEMRPNNTYGGSTHSSDAACGSRFLQRTCGDRPDAPSARKTRMQGASHFPKWRGMAILAVFSHRLEARATSGKASFSGGRPFGNEENANYHLLTLIQLH